MPNQKQVIIPPEGGWKERTYYIVEIAYNDNNPIHGAIFYTGFLNGGPTNKLFKPTTKFPGGYNEIGFTEDFESIASVVYLRVIRELTNDKELDSVPNRDKCPTDKLKT